MDRGVAVLTGASSGIGAATARRPATEGADVAVALRRWSHVPVHPTVVPFCARAAATITRRVP